MYLHANITPTNNYTVSVYMAKLLKKVKSQITEHFFGSKDPTPSIAFLAAFKHVRDMANS